MSGIIKRDTTKNNNIWVKDDIASMADKVGEERLRWFRRIKRRCTTPSEEPAEEALGRGD